MKILLHIGTDKTGSTAIQQHLLMNRSWFLSHSVYLPEIDFGRSNGHSALLSDLQQAQLEALGQKLSHAQDQGYEWFLLSWEGMNFYDAEQVRRLAGIFSGHTIHLLVYLREQADLVQTGFLQQLKSNTNRAPISAFEHARFGLETLVSRRIKFPATRDYYRLLKRWQNEVPDAAFVLRIFDRSLLVDGDIVEDFLAQLDLASDENFRRKQDHSNISLDVETAIVVDRWQREGRAAKDVLRMVDVAISCIAVNGALSKYFLRQDTVKAIRRHYRHSNRKVAREFLHSSEPLFRNTADCWRAQDWADLAMGADRLAIEIATIDKTPTLNNQVNAGEILPSVNLETGWHTPTDTGALISDTYSQLSFRISRRRIGPTCVGVKVHIRGRYKGQLATTEVTINGRPFGRHSLAGRGGQFEIPLEALLPYEVIEVELHHECSTGLAQHGAESSAFELQKVACTYTAEQLPETATATGHP